jgi:sortase A
MGYFFVYLLIIIINIFAILAVLKIRKSRNNDPRFVSEANVVDGNENDFSEINNYAQPKKSFFSRGRTVNPQVVITYDDLKSNDAPIVYDGELLDLAVKKKIVKKKGNWYLFGGEQLGYGKEKAKFYLLENPSVANEISDLVYDIIDVGEQSKELIDVNYERENNTVNSGTQLYQSKNSLANAQTVNFLNQEFEIELAEVYVKANTLKKVLENIIGYEVQISIDISERFNPLITESKKYINEVISMLKEVDYITSAVHNIAKNAKFLGIPVTEQLLREKLDLLSSNRFNIVFTRRPVAKHTSVPRLQYQAKPNNFQKKNNSRPRPQRRRVNSGRKAPLAPLGVGLLVIGLIIVIYSINQTFFSTKVIEDEQNLLAEKFTNTSQIQLQNLNNSTQSSNLAATDEYQESIISIASKTLSNANAKGEFLPDVMGKLTLLSADINHFVVFGSTIENLQFGPGFITGTAFPGTGGNFAIAGHRTTYGAPFGNLDKVEVGDVIFFQTSSNRYTYTVSETKIVSSSDNYVLANFGDDRITLSTCHPKFSAKQRLIVVGTLEKVEVFG